MPGRIRRGGKRLRAAGLRTRKQDCCCDDGGTGGCCNEPGGPPAADFTVDYLQLNPCRYQLHDASTRGICGSIISWLWELPDGAVFDGGGTTSTLQFPPPFQWNGSSGTTFHVSLTVTDGAGCDDTIVLPVTCQAIPCLQVICTDYPVPSFLTVNLSGFTGLAAPLNGTHVLTFFGGFACEYRKVIPNASCGGQNMVILCELTAGGMRVTFPIVGGPGTPADYRKSIAAPYLCRGTHVLDKVPGTGTHACSGPGDPTATVQW